jgi:hypothetical protein
VWWRAACGGGGLAFQVAVKARIEVDLSKREYVVDVVGGRVEFRSPSVVGRSRDEDGPGNDELKMTLAGLARGRGTFSPFDHGSNEGDTGSEEKHGGRKRASRRAL